MCRRGRSWMVQLYMRLLTGRFQVRILVAEPEPRRAPELEIGSFRAPGCLCPDGATPESLMVLPKRRSAAGRFVHVAAWDHDCHRTPKGFQCSTTVPQLLV